MGRHLQSCIEWLEFRSPLLKSMAPHGVRLSVEHDAVYAVYLQAGNVQPERRYSSVIVFGLACIERIPVRSGRWQFWGHFLPHRVVDLQAVFSLDVEVSRDLRAFGDIQCLHTRSLVEQNHIELAFTALHRGIENSVQRRIRISREEVSDCLRREIIKRFVVRHHGHGNAPTKPFEELGSLETLHVISVEDTAGYIDGLQGFDVEQSHRPDQFKPCYNNVATDGRAYLGESDDRV